MVLLPLFASLVAFVCMALVVRDAVRRPRPDKIAWAIAFALFGLAAGLEVVGSLAGWTAAGARLYYLTGAVLVVGYLALGELYLLAPKATARLGPGVTLLVTALAATITFAAPVDAARLEAEGWRAIDRGPALVSLAVLINGLGTVVLVAGALWSAWRFWRSGTNRHRMIGCVLIALGTIAVAMGGTLTRLGQPEYLYVAMAIGVAIIFAGYLETRRSDAPRKQGLAAGAAFGATAPPMATAIASDEADLAVAFLSELLALGPEACGDRCRLWSAEARPIDRFDRDTARRAWAVRTRLGADDRQRFDALPVAVQAQLAELYVEVLAAEPRVRAVEGLPEHRTTSLAAVNR